MSFILDALKKLEENRHDDSVPDLTTIHAESNIAQEKRNLLTYLLVAILIINAVVLAVWLRPQEEKKSQYITQDTKTNNEKPAPAVQNRNEAVAKNEALPEQKVIETAATPDIIVAKKIEAQPLKTTQLPINPSPEEIKVLKKKMAEEQLLVTSAPTIEPEPEEENEPALEGNVLNMSQLPIPIKKQLPDLTITAHIYSNDPLSRLVNINGNIIREGDTVTEGLRVNEITTSGIILDYKGLLFSLNAF